MNAKFDIVYMEPALKFLQSLPEKVQDKIAFNLSKSRFILDNDIFKKLTDDIWEFRTHYQGNTYRLLAFWDNDNGRLVVATHGFIKKTQKTPQGEIKRAHALRIEYFKNK